MYLKRNDLVVVVAGVEKGKQGRVLRVDEDSNRVTVQGVNLRYKQPEGEKSTLMEQDVFDEGRDFESGSPDFQWAASVAAFGMILRDSPHKGAMTMGAVEEIARSAKGADRAGHRDEFLRLVQVAKALKKVK